MVPSASEGLVVIPKEHEQEKKMSIKFFYSSEKTNSFRPVPWHWSLTPFPAYRGEGARHRGFLPVAREYQPSFVGSAPSREGYGCPTTAFDPTPSKLVKSKEKGTLMLVTCSPEQDEQILLVTLRGGFRGWYSRIEVKGGEVLANTASNVHCCPTAHLVVRLTHPNGFVYAETGRRSGTGLVEIFSWEGYKTMPTEEFETWLRDSAPDLTDTTKADTKAKVEVDRKAAVVKAREQQAVRDAKARIEAEVEQQRKAQAERMKPILESRLTILSNRRQAIGFGAITLDEEYYHYSESSWNHREYTEANVDKTQAEVVAEEAKYAEKKAFEAGLEELKPRMETLGVIFHDDRGTFIAREEGEYNQYFNYTPDDLEKLRKFVEQIEEKAAEAKRQAEAKAERERQEAEAAATGLPQNVEVWKRRGGATNAGDGWVVMPNGMCRELDEMRCPRPRYPDEGTQVWRQILPGELVLRWAKAYTAAEHEFEVVYRPDSITREQMRTVALLEEELSEERGSVGLGWGLRKLPKAEPKSQAPVGGWSIEDLKAKYRK